jgi:glucokinase
LKLPVYLINDGNASVLGEKFYGSGKRCKNLVYVTLSSGIGGGAIINNNLLLGRGNALEIGHMVIDKDCKLRCGCGKKGHWEAYCSGNNIQNFLRIWLRKGRLPNKYSDVYKIFDCAKKGDKTILKFLKEVGRLNAIGFANLINLFDPELITIGGGIALNNKSFVLNPIKKYLKDYVFNKIPKIEITKLGDDVAIYGCMAYYFKLRG